MMTRSIKLSVRIDWNDDIFILEIRDSLTNVINNS